MSHQHQLPFADRLPPPPSAIGPAAREAALRVVAALEAGCEDCYRQAITELAEAQRRPASESPSAGRPSDLAEAAYADLLWAAASLLIRQADQLGIEPVAHADGKHVRDLTGAGVPEALHTSAKAVVGSLRLLVEHAADTERAVELARGVTATAELLGIDGHTMLLQYVELAARALFTVGAADQLAAVAFLSDSQQATPAAAEEPTWAVLTPDGRLEWYPASATSRVEAIVGGKRGAVDSAWVTPPLRFLATDAGTRHAQAGAVNLLAERVIATLSDGRVARAWHGAVALCEYLQDSGPDAAGEWLWPKPMAQQWRQRIEAAVASAQP